MNNLKIYCVTDKKLDYLEDLDLLLASAGKNQLPNKYINCNEGDNINYKEEYYSELTFHYWFWKNRLNQHTKNEWIGFCQKRRFWVNDISNEKIINIEMLKKNLLTSIPAAWNDYTSILCNPTDVSNPKKIKLIKRGWKNLIKDPSIFYLKKKQTIKLQFDMHHGYGILDKAIEQLDNKDKDDFRIFVNKEYMLNANIMFISKKEILEKWFEDLFSWLFKCEKIFGFDDLKSYDQKRLYAFLSERYLPFWFKKNSKSLNWPWAFFEKINKL